MRRRRRSSRNRVSAIVLFLATAIGRVLLSEALDDSPSRNPGIVEMLTGVPGKIVGDALDHGVLSVMLFGTFEERHRFAKGQSTPYGHMSFDADVHLRKNAGWSERHIHNLGFLYGFSIIRPDASTKGLSKDSSLESEEAGLD